MSLQVLIKEKEIQLFHLLMNIIYIKTHLIFLIMKYIKQDYQDLIDLIKL